MLYVLYAFVHCMQPPTLKKNSEKTDRMHCIEPKKQNLTWAYFSKASSSQKTLDFQQYISLEK